jgi:ubiquitin-protein ligase
MTSIDKKSNNRTKRLMNEMKELETSTSILAESGIYFYYDESNMNIVYSMMIGPKDTPYENGFYFFKFEYPESYPFQPPVAKYYTQGIFENTGLKSHINVRFNPNLYVCGKVCLSMLNTWTGPGWVPTNTLCNVLVAIQALVLNDFPLTNEPGFENANRKELLKYNEVIFYANIKIAVIQMLQNTPPEFIPFKDKMKDIFMSKVEWYKNIILTKNDQLHNSLIESPAYGLKVITEYEKLLSKIIELEETL